jgi:hypothetical membrane protein
VVTGVLLLAGAYGLSRPGNAARPGRAGPVFLAIVGVCLVIGGIFPPDPALGFPPGTPDSRPDHMSLHGTIHAVVPALGFFALAVTLLLLAGRLAGAGLRATRVGAVVVVLLSVYANVSGNFLSLWAGTVIGFCWLSWLLARISRTTSVAAVAAAPVG